MALITADLKGELKQVKDAVDDVIKKSVNPMIKGAIDDASEKIEDVVQKAIKQASSEINGIVENAGGKIEGSIKALSEEVHGHRQLTQKDLKEVIDHAVKCFGDALDQRLIQAKKEATDFVVERVDHLKKELEDAAIKSRRALYFNLSVSIVSAVAMAVIGVLYKKISMGELDLFATFRVFLLSAATGTAVFSAIKFLQGWVALNKGKKNVATVIVNHMSLLRPNGAVGLLLLSIGLLVAWYFSAFYL